MSSENVMEVNFILVCSVVKSIAQYGLRDRLVEDGIGIN